MAGVERIPVPLRARRRTVLPAALVALALGLGGCSQAGTTLEEHNEVAHGNAQPAQSPPAGEITEGEVIDLPGDVRALLATGDRVVAQLDGPERLEIGGVEGDEWSPERTVDLPGEAGTASVALDGTVLVPHDDGVVVVPPGGPERDLSGLGPVTAAALTGDGRLITGDDDGDVVVRDADGVELHRLVGMTAVDRLPVARDGSVSALSRPDTVLGSISLEEDQAGPLLRAGRGAGMVAPYGGNSVVVSDTVGGTLLVYSTSPVRLHQMFPVAEAPWAVAEDPVRELVWMTSTAENRLQAYDLRDGLGEERFDVATIRQPDSLAVTDSGTVVVGSAAGEGLHLLRPDTSD